MEKNASEIAKLTERISKDPRSKLFVPLAEEYKKAGDIEMAVAVLMQGLAQNPGYVTAKSFLGRLLFEKGDLAAAQKEFEEVVKAIPDNLLAQRKLGDIYAIQGKRTEALGCYRTVMTLNPRDLEAASLIRDIEAGISVAEKLVRPTTGVAQPAASTVQKPAAPAPAPGKPAIAPAKQPPPAKPVVPASESPLPVPVAPVAAFKEKEKPGEEEPEEVFFVEPLDEVLLSDDLPVIPEDSGAGSTQSILDDPSPAGPGEFMQDHGAPDFQDTARPADTEDIFSFGGESAAEEPLPDLVSAGETDLLINHERTDFRETGRNAADGFSLPALGKAPGSGLEKTQEFDFGGVDGASDSGLFAAPSEFAADAPALDDPSFPSFDTPLQQQDPLFGEPPPEFSREAPVFPDASDDAFSPGGAPADIDIFGAPESVFDAGAAYGDAGDSGQGNDDSFAIPSFDSVSDPLPEQDAVSGSRETDDFTTDTLAELYIAQGFYEKAIEIYERMTAEKPDSKALREKLASVRAMADGGAHPADPSGTALAMEAQDEPVSSGGSASAWPLEETREYHPSPFSPSEAHDPFSADIQSSDNFAGQSEASEPGADDSVRYAHESGKADRQETIERLESWLKNIMKEK